MPYLLTAASGDYSSASDSAAFSIGPDFEFEIDVALDDYASGANQYLINKWGAAGNRSFRVGFNSVGGFLCHVSVDGTATVFSAAAPLGLTDGTRYVINGEYDADDGGGNRVLTITVDGGSPVTDTDAGTVASIFDSSADLEVPSPTAAPGKYYRARLWDGIGGTLVFDADFSDPTTWTFS